MSKMDWILGGVIGSALTFGILALLSSDDECTEEDASSADDAILEQETLTDDEADAVTA